MLRENPGIGMTFFLAANVSVFFCHTISTERVGLWQNADGEEWICMDG